MAIRDETDLKFNQKLLLGLFLYTTFSSALRKWVFPGNGAVDSVLLVLNLFAPLLLTYFMRREKGGLLYFPILPFAVILMVLALNPLGHTLFHGALGFVLHIGFWLMMLIYVQERDSFPVEKLMGPMLICCAIEGLLGFMQFSLPSTHFINRYVSDNNDVAGFGEVATRIVGTFSYISGYGAFLVFFGMFVWALMVENRRSLLITYGLTAVGLVAAFMNGSRSVVLPFVMTAVFGFLSYATIGKKLKVVAAVGLIIGLGLGLGLDEKLDFMGKAYDAFAARVEGGQATGETAGRTTRTLGVAFEYDGVYPIFGIGLGATYQGAVAKWGASPLLHLGYETEPERILIEGGYFLFIIRTALLIYLLGKLRIPLYFSFPIMFYLFMFSLLTFNTNQAVYTFFGIMLLDKLYYLKEKGELSTVDS